MSRALFDEIENWAILFRQQYGLSLFEPIRIKSLLQKLDVLTVYKDMSVGISGMAIKIEGVKSTNRFLLVRSEERRVGKEC